MTAVETLKFDLSSVCQPDECELKVTTSLALQMVNNLRLRTSPGPDLAGGRSGNQLKLARNITETVWWEVLCWWEARTSLLLIMTISCLNQNMLKRYLVDLLQKWNAHFTAALFQTT